LFICFLLLLFFLFLRLIRYANDRDLHFSLHDALPIYLREAEDLTHKEFTFSEWLSVSKSQPDPKSAPTEKEIKFQLIDDFIEKSDRKSTRLNSSHVKISYAVFCLKKKIQQQRTISQQQ